eukprot:snap_masked-scaffold_15-processed-gene-10.48-mRNA-1 protein AED:1.00 eAED:1.00 QI:0/-1/0/0/-1/1/1/0/114
MSMMLSLLSGLLSQSLSENMGDNYLPCNIVSTITGSTHDPACNYVEFLDYSANLARSAGNPAAELLSQLEELYTACFFADLSMSECPQLFSALFLNGAFQNVLTIQQMILRARL